MIIAGMSQLINKMYKIDDYHRSEIILKPTWGDFDRKIAVSFTCHISKEALLEALVF